MYSLTKLLPFTECNASRKRRSCLFVCGFFFQNLHVIWKVVMVGVVAGFCGCAWFVFSTTRIPQSLTFSGGGKIARPSLNFINSSFNLIFSGILALLRCCPVL